MNVEILRQGTMAISVIDLLISLGVAFLLGLWVVFTYRITHRGLTYERTFLVTLIMSAPIVGLVMLLIGSNLALSLGMVGALSIIRFRNVIKSPRDMVFLFWTIAIGLGCGTYNWLVIIIASGFISGCLLILHYVEYGKQRHHELVCVLGGAGEPPGSMIVDLLSVYAKDVVVRSLERRPDSWEMVVELRFPVTRLDRQHELLKEVHRIDGVEHVSLLAPHLSLPV